MIRIGQIGMAHDHAEGKMKCVQKFPDIFEVVGVAEENPVNLRKFGQWSCYQNLPILSIDELLSTSGLDAVMIETDELSLVHSAKKCVDRGVHIHLDKPAGGNVEDFEQLLSAAKQNKLIVQLAYMYRYNPAIQYCINSIHSGKLGEIYRVQAIMNLYHPPEKRAWMKPFPAGNMFFLGCHMVDLILLMMGIPENIIPYNRSTGFDGVDVIDTGYAVFEYKNGIATAEACNNEVDGFRRRSLLVCGSRGSMEIRPLEGDGCMPEATLSLLEQVDGRVRTVTQRLDLPLVTGRYDSMMLDFARMITEEQDNPFTYEYELLVQKAVLAACGLPVKAEYIQIKTS